MGSNLYNGDLSPNGDLNGSTPKIYGANPPPAWSSRKYSDSNLNIPFFWNVVRSVQQFQS